MIKSDIVKVFELLGSKSVKETHNSVMGTCPLAEYLHDSGQDTEPSFGIFEGRTSTFNCFGCGKSGKLSYLPFLLSQYSGRFNYQLNSYIQENDYSPLIKKYRGEKIVLRDNEILRDQLMSFEEAQPKMGLYRTDINNEVWHLRYDPENKAMVFPIFDKKKRLLALKGRRLGSHNFFQYNEFKIKQAGIWYGMHQKCAYEKIVLVEGERDAILLSYHGLVAWASMGAMVTQAQIETLRKEDHSFILFFDNDKAGKEVRDKIRKECGAFNPLYVIRKYWGCKDPAELVEQNKLKLALSSMRRTS